jgi:hypothetical protein
MWYMQKPWIEGEAILRAEPYCRSSYFKKKRRKGLLFLFFLEFDEDNSCD